MAKNHHEPVTLGPALTLTKKKKKKKEKEKLQSECVSYEKLVEIFSSVELVGSHNGS